jgi:hypothetical protein
MDSIICFFISIWTPYTTPSRDTSKLYILRLNKASILHVLHGEQIDGVLWNFHAPTGVVRTLPETYCGRRADWRSPVEFSCADRRGTYPARNVLRPSCRLTESCGIFMRRPAWYVPCPKRTAAVDLVGHKWWRSTGTSHKWQEQDRERNTRVPVSYEPGQYTVVWTGGNHPTLVGGVGVSILWAGATARLLPATVADASRPLRLLAGHGTLAISWLGLCLVGAVKLLEVQ